VNKNIVSETGEKLTGYTLYLTTYLFIIIYSKYSTINIDFLFDHVLIKKYGQQVNLIVAYIFFFYYTENVKLKHDLPN